MSHPVGLTLYRAALRLAAPLAPLALDRRAARGKEDPARLKERQGMASAPRPEGELVWLHAASVGESALAVALAEGLLARREDLSILITTGTLTSARRVAEQAPPGVIHQFVPIDRLDYARRFAAHWRPDLAVFVESELWPNLIIETARTGARMALVNARMNAASLRNWTTWPSSAAWLLACFDTIGAADARTAKGLSNLSGQPIPLVGNLKLDLPAPPPAADALAEARSIVGERKILLAASTHDGEETALIAAFTQIRAAEPDALLILAPRHPDRADAIADILSQNGLAFARRSKAETPAPDTPVWLADTLGEMALWFTLGPAAFIGGSLKPDIGGHNPVEATRARAAVISGPYRDSFSDIYDAYEAHDAVATAADPDAIAAATLAIWRGEAPTVAAGEAALAALSGGALQTTLDTLIALLDANTEPA